MHDYWCSMLCHCFMSFWGVNNLRTLASTRLFLGSFALSVGCCSSFGLLSVVKAYMWLPLHKLLACFIFLGTRMLFTLAEMNTFWLSDSFAEFQKRDGQKTNFGKVHHFCVHRSLFCAKLACKVCTYLLEVLLVPAFLVPASYHSHTSSVN